MLHVCVFWVGVCVGGWVGGVCELDLRGVVSFWIRGPPYLH